MVLGLAPPIFGSSDMDKVGRGERSSRRSGDGRCSCVVLGKCLLDSGLLGLGLLIY